MSEWLKITKVTAVNEMKNRSTTILVPGNAIPVIWSYQKRKAIPAFSQTLIKVIEPPLYGFHK